MFDSETTSPREQTGKQLKAQPPDSHPFVAYLVDRTIISQRQGEQLVEVIRVTHESPLAVALRTAMVDEQRLYAEMAAFTGYETITPVALAQCLAHDFSGLPNALSPQWCAERCIGVWADARDQLCVAISDFAETETRDTLSGLALRFGRTLCWRIAPRSTIESAIRSAFDSRSGRASKQGLSLAQLRELAEDGPIIELVNSILSAAVTARASDIHLEPAESYFAVRLRVDGIMREVQRHPSERFDATVCRVKILAGLDIAERRLPHDGRLTARIQGETFDVRVSIMPGVRGESVVLRLLRQERAEYSLRQLGMRADHEALFNRWIDLANGIVLVTGPTGSGKTTTLYTALDLSNNGLKKIITVEDPVEYKLNDIVQLQVNSDIGYTFASALRSILRHDPDVVLVGEMRDTETASIAVQAALTGHLVLSTLHTNSAIGSITRLMDMGVERFLLASSLRGLMAQRLLRRLCDHCKAPADPAAIQTQWVERLHAVQQQHDAESLGSTLYRAVGCDHCMHTGYHGRVAVYELIDIDDALREMMQRAASESELSAHVRSTHARTLFDDALLKVGAGQTSFEEALQVA